MKENFNKNLSFFVAVFFSLLTILFFSAQVYAYQSFKQIYTDPKIQKELKALVYWSIQEAFSKNNLPRPQLSNFFKQSLPIFITLKKEGEVRGCMGALRPQQGDLAGEISHFVDRALFYDPWHRRVSVAELEGMEVYMTAVGHPIPVRNISELSPVHDAVYLRQGSKGAVVLPGEAKTQRYLLALLKTKAGVNVERPYQLFRLPSLSVGINLDSSLFNF